MIKMLAVDIDGTIMNWDLSISGKVKSCLRTLSENGIKVVIATGRMYNSALLIAKEIGINSPIVCYQGALIKDCQTGETIYDMSLEETTARKVIKDLKKDKEFINIYINDKLYVEEETDYISEYAITKKVDYKVVGDFNSIEFKSLNKILVMNKDPEKIIKLVKNLNHNYKDKVFAVKSTPTYCEICNPKATKGNAIKFLANMWNIKQEEIMAAGDQDNDIEMLKAAGVKVAMGNATEELKAVANYITDSIDNDGIVKAVEKFIEIEDRKWNTESVKATTFIN